MNNTEVEVGDSVSGVIGTVPEAVAGIGAVTRRPTAELSSGDPTSLTQELDRISLVQALSDTEAATARVIDLTERLVDARHQITGLRGELDVLRIEHHHLLADHNAMKTSKAFRIGSVIWNVRNALRI